MARAIAEPMQAALRQPVLVENHPGAGGNIAADAVAKSAADGYTLLVSFSSHTINATLYAKLPFDPVTDFTPITMIARVPSLLVGNPKLPASDLAALIDLAKKKPDTLTIGIGGLGSSLHLAGEQFKMMTGVRLLNVPYKGTAPALTDVLGGQVDLMFISLVTGTAQVRAGAYVPTVLPACNGKPRCRMFRRLEKWFRGSNRARGLAYSLPPIFPLRLPISSTPRL